MLFNLLLSKSTKLIVTTINRFAVLFDYMLNKVVNTQIRIKILRAIGGCLGW
jgi:sulfur carrier protein ThiS